MSICCSAAKAIYGCFPTNGCLLFSPMVRGVSIAGWVLAPTRTPPRLPALRRSQCVPRLRVPTPRSASRVRRANRHYRQYCRPARCVRRSAASRTATWRCVLRFSPVPGVGCLGCMQSSRSRLLSRECAARCRWSGCAGQGACLTRRRWLAQCDTWWLDKRLPAWRATIRPLISDRALVDCLQVPHQTDEPGHATRGGDVRGLEWYKVAQRIFRID